MTEQTDAAEVEGPYAGRSMAEIIDDYVLVRGDLTEPYARTQLLRIIAAREAAAEARGAERALREAADAMGRAARDGGSHWRAHAWGNWLRARAAAAGGAR